MPNSISFVRHQNRRLVASSLRPTTRALFLSRNASLLICFFILVSISIYKIWNVDQITLTIPLERTSLRWLPKSTFTKGADEQRGHLAEELKRLGVEELHRDVLQALEFSEAKSRLGTKERPQHTFRPDGLLEVNFNASHPIPELIKQSEEKWNSKLRRASKTLAEAVDEYKRRYNRMPPTNFDVWWDYASSHNVILPDEYDSIHRALEPFWGIAPSTLQSTLDTWSQVEKHGLILFGKTSPYSPIEILQNEMLPEDRQDVFATRVDMRINLLEEVEDWIPPFKALISPHDNPGILIDWEVREKALEAAKKGTYMDPDFKPSEKHGWRSGCPPSSPAHQSFPHALNEPFNGTFEFLPSPSSYPRKAFIHDHALSTSICNHPTHFITHSQFLSHPDGGPAPRSLPGIIPQFSNCASEIHADMVLVPAQAYDEFNNDLKWEEKVDERILWRGSPTGMWHGDIEADGTELWRQAQRERLVNLTNTMSGKLKILKPSQDLLGRNEDNKQDKPDLTWEPVGEPEEWPSAWVNAAMMDVAFAGEPIQCEGKGCTALRDGYEWRYKMGYEDSKRYKYIVDIDGNGWSSRFRRLLSSNSLIFKSTIYPEWFTDRIQEWVHYVPILSDYSDLYDALVFFRGDLKGEGRHDDAGKKIAEAGAWWTRNVWRREDMVAFMFRYMLEYSRVMSLDRDALTYEPPVLDTNLPKDSNPDNSNESS